MSNLWSPLRLTCSRMYGSRSLAQTARWALEAGSSAKSQKAYPSTADGPGRGLGTGINYPTEAPDRSSGFDYDHFYAAQLKRKKQDQSYRYFNKVDRLAKYYPKAHHDSTDSLVTVWCSNDYLGMSRNPKVLQRMHNTLDEHGSGAGGTRNISGHNKHVESLETTLADLHHKEAALVCTSCYVANEATLSTLGSILPECVIFSDSMNHASMIQGIRHSGAKKVIFRHNDMHDLEARLAAVPLHVPKIIAFESVYSMSGTVSDIRHICDLAKKYAAITFLDEAHGVGLYGPSGAGVAEHLDYDAHLAGHHRGTVMDRVDIITGTLAKAYGCVGGYIAGKGTLVDVVRSLTPSFIFTTSLPPAVLAGAEAAVNYQRQTGADRKAQQVHVRSLKNALRKSNIPILENETHIIPILVGDAAMARKASELLLSKWHIYIQAINAPTVPVGQEILRITPTSGHSKEMQDHLVTALKDVWHELGIKQATQWLMYKGHTVDQDIADALLPGATPLWTDQQLDHIGSAKSAV